MQEKEMFHERRQRTLTEADVELITTIVKQCVAKPELDHFCKFEGIDPEMAKEAIRFFKSYTEALQDTKSTVRKFLVVTILTALTALLGAGIYVKFKG